ncbi:hypothetical protein VTL71DRAFT_9408 [Oculimacula yallundae]|uniref:SET domain-containing protein n=1 Tax=Oculimacula yallundae TaxID=86028 RepID=A0ABR4BUI4_9HELO
MAPGPPSAARGEVIDLTSDNDEPQPHSRPQSRSRPAPRSSTNSRGTADTPIIDLDTPPPEPSHPTRISHTKASFQERQSSNARPSDFRPGSITAMPAVKLSPPSAPSRNYSADPPSNPQPVLASQGATGSPATVRGPGISLFGGSRTPALPGLSSLVSPRRRHPGPASSTERQDKGDEDENGNGKEDEGAESGREDGGDDGDDNDDDDDEIEDIHPSHNPATHAISPPKQPTNEDHSLDNEISSIGSTSPLLYRIRQQRKTKDMIRNDPPFSSHLEEQLQSCLEGMVDDHALSTRYLLADSWEASVELNNRTIDQISPFTSLRSTALEPKALVLPEIVTDVMFHYRNGKTSRTKSQLAAIEVSGDTPRVPRYSSHTNIRRNILKADDEKLKFIPFLGDSRNETNHKRLMKELEQVYTPRPSEGSPESEEKARIRQYLPWWLEKLHMACDLNALQHDFLLQEEESGDLGMRPRTRKLLLESFGEPLAPATRKTAQMFSREFYKVFGMSVRDIVLPPAIVKEMIVASRSKAAKKEYALSPNRIETYTDMTCLICAAIDCQIHGDFTHERIDSSDVEDDGQENLDEWKYEPKGLVLHYEDTIRQHKNRPKVEIKPLPTHELEPCTNECYMVTDFSDLEYEFDEQHLASLPQMISTWKHPNYRPCTISSALNIPCWTVYAEIQRYESEQHEEVVEFVPPGRAKKPEWYDNKKKTIKGDLNDFTTVHLHQERGQAVACGHPGPCIVRPGGDSCACASTDVLCEYFCGCSDDCPRRFTGCPCAASGLACSTDSCICIQMNRECGPQCGTCGASARVNPANRFDYELFETGCQNVCLQRGVSKATVMGESQLVGFGLYLAEPVKKGAYISEYRGENISNEEAERRGIVYERKAVSFLFDINAERAIDAARLGNKTRFINHAGSASDGLNIEAKIMLVNGEHRIKFVALRDINIGEELLFNYGRKFADRQGLNKTLPKAEAGSRKGVLEGEDALDALDGMDQRKKGSREKIKAIRESAKSGGQKAGSKMRKTAVLVRADVKEETEEDFDDEGDVDERPRRRKIAKPIRYTQ